MGIEHNFDEAELVVKIILAHRNIELCVWMKQDQARLDLATVVSIGLKCVHEIYGCLTSPWLLTCYDVFSWYQPFPRKVLGAGLASGNCLKPLDPCVQELF